LGVPVEIAEDRIETDRLHIFRNMDRGLTPVCTNLEFNPDAGIKVDVL